MLNKGEEGENDDEDDIVNMYKARNKTLRERTDNHPSTNKDKEGEPSGS